MSLIQSYRLRRPPLQRNPPNDTQSDYCNALLYGVADKRRRLQSVQNAAARLVSGLRRRDHIRPTLLRLHWLPVRQRVLFKIAVLVCQCVNGLAPSYLADDCQLVSDVRPRQLRSSDSVTCAVRRIRTTYGDRYFAVAGPRVWNSLPTELRQSDSLGQFKRRLKTIVWVMGRQHLETFCN